MERSDDEPNALARSLFSESQPKAKLEYCLASFWGVTLGQTLNGEQPFCHTIAALNSHGSKLAYSGRFSVFLLLVAEVSLSLSLSLSPF